MTKYLNSSIDVITFFQFHSDNNNNLIMIPPKLRSEFAVEEMHSKKKLLVEDIIMMNNYKYYCEVIEKDEFKKDIAYSCFIPKFYK